MKKRYLVLAGVLAAAVAASGCGKKDKIEEPDGTIQTTAAPVQEDTDTAEPGELVDMKKITDEPQNVIGDKTKASGKLTLVNSTGADVKEFYVRPTTDYENDWGEDLIGGAFTLKNRDKVLYYFDKNLKDDEGKTVSRYDVRIVYVDGDRTENYFRKLPLATISQLTLCMEDGEDFSIPYAKYTSSTDKKETSTLQEVKERLGLTEDYSQEEGDETPQPTQAPQEPTPTPEEDNQGPVDNPGEGSEDQRDLAASFIGRPLDELIAACGNPVGNDYVDEPETGETGYHYYDRFTISTTVDEDGNEVVAGVY